MVAIVNVVAERSATKIAPKVEVLELDARTSLRISG